MSGRSAKISYTSLPPGRRASSLGAVAPCRPVRHRAPSSRHRVRWRRRDRSSNHQRCPRLSQTPVRPSVRRRVPSELPRASLARRRTTRRRELQSEEGSCVSLGAPTTISVADRASANAFSVAGRSPNAGDPWLCGPASRPGCLCRMERKTTSMIERDVRRSS